MFRHILNLMISVICTLMISNSVFSEEGEKEDNFTIASGVYSADASTTIFGDPSNSGILNNSVNLYTGQHAESFPLLSIQGRGGLSLPLSLSYNGNVSSIVKTENRKAQASPFGLGFSFGLESIIVDHKNTLEFRDDEYMFSSGGSIQKLIPISLSSPLIVNNDTIDVKYVPESGAQWIAFPTLESIDSNDYVIGWTIIKEDGTYYRYGDFIDSLDGFNATRNILSWGDWVGQGEIGGDKKFPSQWDLKTIHDADSLNWINFSYLQEEAYMTNVTTSSTTNTSDNSYTRYSYLSKITTSDGKKIDFTYIARNDYQPFYQNNNYEYYSTKKINEILVRNRDNEVLSKVSFKFGMLVHNSGSTSKFGKLLLERISYESHNSTEKLPPIKFNYSYDKNSSFGSIEEIIFPTGGKKKFFYSAVDSTVVYSTLNSQIADSANSASVLWLEGNIYVHKYKNGILEVGVWDGYWHADTVDTDFNYDDYVGISPDGWLVYQPDNNNLVVMRWTNGYWVTDTLDDTFARYEDTYFYLSKDAFVVLTGKTGNETELVRSSFYRWDNKQWQRFGDYLIHPSTIYLGGVRVDKNKYVISYYSKSNGFYENTVLFWDLNPSTGIFRWNDRANIPLSDDYIVGDNIILGNDYIGFAAKHYLLTFSKTDYWNINDSIDIGGFQYMNDLTQLPNGYAYSYSHMDDGGNAYIKAKFNSGHTTSQLLSNGDPGANVISMWGSNNSLALLSNGAGGPNAWLWKWYDNDWLYVDHLESDVDIGKSMKLYGDSYYYGSPTSQGSSPYSLSAGRYLGDNTWSTQIINGTGITKGFDASNDLVAFKKGDTAHLFVWNPYYYGDEFGDFSFMNLDDTLDESITSEDGYLFNIVSLGASANTFSVNYRATIIDTSYTTIGYKDDAYVYEDGLDLTLA